MGQSNVIFGAILIAFIVFITLRGELPTYMNLLRGVGTPDNQSSPTDSLTSGTPLSSLSSSLGGMGGGSDPVSGLMGNAGGMGIPSINASSLSSGINIMGNY